MKRTFAHVGQRTNGTSPNPTLRRHKGRRDQKSSPIGFSILPSKVALCSFSWPSVDRFAQTLAETLPKLWSKVHQGSDKLFYKAGKRRVLQSSEISKNDLEGTKSPWATWASAAVDPARRPWAIQQSTKDFLNQ